MPVKKPAPELLVALKVLSGTRPEGRCCIILLTALTLCTTLAVASCGDGPEGGDRELVRVVRIVDGDTVELADGRIVRYLGVDTPEIAHNSTQEDDCYGQEATVYNSSMVLNKDIELEFDVEREDRYGRTLAWIWLVDNGGDRLLNEEIVFRGYAKVLIIPPNGMYEDVLREAEDSAKDRNAGLWGACTSSN